MWHPALTFDIVWLQVYFCVVQAKWQITYVGFLLILNHFLSCPFWLCLAVVLCPSSITQLAWCHPLPTGVSLTYVGGELRRLPGCFACVISTSVPPTSPETLILSLVVYQSFFLRALTRCAAFQTVAPVLGVSARAHACKCGSSTSDRRQPGENVSACYLLSVSLFRRKRANWCRRSLTLPVCSNKTSEWSAVWLDWSFRFVSKQILIVCRFPFFVFF